MLRTGMAHVVRILAASSYLNIFFLINNYILLSCRAVLKLFKKVSSQPIHFLLFTTAQYEKSKLNRIWSQLNPKSLALIHYNGAGSWGDGL